MNDTILPAFAQFLDSIAAKELLLRNAKLAQERIAADARATAAEARAVTAEADRDALLVEIAILKRQYGQSPERFVVQMLDTGQWFALGPPSASVEAIRRYRIEKAAGNTVRIVRTDTGEVVEVKPDEVK